MGTPSRTSKTVSNINNTHAITLIALVITIILLLILAGVVINLTLGENGILNKAEQAGEQYQISEILEKLELEKVDLYAGKNGEVPSVGEYIDHLINKGIITIADVEDIDNDTKNIIVDGYLFVVEKEASGNIKITYQGKATKEPRIAKIQVIGTTIDSISVKVITANVNGGTYKYSIKNVTTGETSFTDITTITSNEYTFTSLQANNDYIIQVELTTSEATDVKQTEIIKAEAPKVRIITLDKTTINMYTVGNEKITAEVKPEEALDRSVTWTSSNETVATVDNTGVVTAVGEGVAIITVTSNEVNTVTATCNVTVTTPPPPTVGVGATTHTAKQIPYNWEELNTIAKLISNNYGQITNNTAEVNVSINGKADTLGIGDWTTVNGKQVRILGFNHDTLTNKGVYGGTNTYAGISFEFVTFLSTSAMNSSSDNSNGWGSCTARSTLNSTSLSSLENKSYIKQVNKLYLKDRLSATKSTSADYLWLLSTSEIWGTAKLCKANTGTQYKYYKSGGNIVKSGAYWTRNCPTTNASSYISVSTNGAADGTVTSNSKRGWAPGFAI